MMTLEEAIKHCKDVALSCTNKECALEHFQLLKWLQEYNNMLEKQGEKSVDKVESKFKVDDWVVNNTTLNSCHIVKVEHGQYICDDCSFPITKESEYHLWTIQDAKDGDVLVHNGCTFIFMGIKDGIVQALEENLIDDANPVSFGEPNKDNDYHPATKEQRDLLSQKMKEAGYEWDAKRKELKKIKSPAWSEEDEHYKQNIIDFLKHPDLIKATPTITKNAIDWLKSLKDRVGCEANCTTTKAWSKEDETKLRQVEYACMKFYGGDCSHIDW